MVRLFAVVSLFTIHSPLATVVNAADPGIEFGAADDLSVMGVEGDAIDPDIEIKGFSVFGSTQISYPGIVPGPGNVAVNGFLSVSSGAYFAADSTFTVISVGSITTGGAGVIFSTNAYFMSGSVGIGTTDPGAKLHVSGGNILLDNDRYLYTKNTGGTGQIAFGMNASNVVIVGAGGNSVSIGSGGGTTTIGALSGAVSKLGVYGSAAIGSSYYVSAAPADGMIIQGNVGIGTAAPGAKLHAVETNGANSYIFVASTAADSGSYKMVVSTTGNVGIGNGGTTTIGALGGALNKLGVYGSAAIGSSYYYSVAAPADGLTVQGNVGIGTPGGGQRLHIYDSNAGVRSILQLQMNNSANDGTDKAFIGFAIGNPGDFGAKIGASRTNTFGRSDLLFYTSDTAAIGDNSQERARITNAGNVGIGTAAPGARLEVMQTDNAQPYSVKVGTSASAYHLVVSTNGNVGIGTTNPGQKLTVAGTVESTSGGFKFPDGNTRSGISYAQLNADAQTFAANAWTAISWAGASIANGISVSGTAITFTQTGVYKITTMCRSAGGDVWTGTRLYGDGSTRGKSSGYGDAATVPSTTVFLADVTNTAVTYQLQIGRLASAITLITPVVVVGETLSALVTTIEKIGQ